MLSTRLEKAVHPLPQFATDDVAKLHMPPNPKIIKLMAIEDPLVRSGYQRMSLFPSAAYKLYPKEWQRAHELGVM